jgi:LysM repeat protein
VAKGDTLYSLSKKYNIPVEELKSLNAITDSGISIGQKLKLGDGKQWTITKLNEKSLALEMGGERKRFPYTSVHFLFYNYIYAMKRKIDKSPERIIDLT